MDAARAGLDEVNPMTTPAQDDLLRAVLDVVRPFLAPGIDVTSATPLADVLDSLSLVHVIVALEQRLGMTLGPTQIVFDHFASCGTLAGRLAAIRSGE